MAHEIKMPQLSDTMDSGKIVVWHKKVGDTIERGDALAEVETDKANLEIEAFQKGTLLKVVVEADQEANVGEIIGYIGEKGEDAPDASASSGTTEPAQKQKEQQQETATAPEKEQHNKAEAAGSTSAPDRNEQEDNSESSKTEDGRIKASPLAKRIASQAGVKLSSIVGSGPGGRIVKKDVQAAMVGGGASRTDVVGTVVPTSSSSQLPALTNRGAIATTGARVQQESSGEGTYAPLSKMRATIARRMQQTVLESPHFYVRTSICMDNALALRAQFKQNQSLAKVSVNHMIIKACGYALTKEPRVNCALKNDMLFTPGGVHIGIVTSVEGGLMIPVVKNVPNLSLKDLAFDATAAIERARNGRPNPDDLSGGTFSISNMGMFDVDDFTALINPGQGAILAVSSTKETPVVKNGRIEVARMMNVTLSVDHRIIDGVMAGNFLKAFKEALEQPAIMLA